MSSTLSDNNKTNNFLTKSAIKLTELRKHVNFFLN